jgi:hypothetical protein
MPATIRPCSGPGIFMCCFANLAHVDWRRRGGSFAEASVYGRNAWNKRTKEQPRTEIEGKIVSLTSLISSLHQEEDSCHVSQLKREGKRRSNPLGKVIRTRRFCDFRELSPYGCLTAPSYSPRLKPPRLTVDIIRITGLVKWNRLSGILAALTPAIAKMYSVYYDEDGQCPS